MSTYLRAITAAAAAATAAACGGGGGDGGGDGGGGDDAGVDAGPDVSACGFAGDAYLPYAPGYTWSYRVTDLGDGERVVKEQRIDPEMDSSYGPVVVQVTGKLDGETVSLTRRDDDRVLRFQQEDHDATGAIERTTIYDPYQVRIDESAEHVALGAEWNEEYTEIEIGPDGVEVSRVDTLDQLRVLGVDDPCDSPMGEFRCLRVRRTRLAGGVAEKEFHFARGIGKIREVGANQLEELTGCAPQGE
jgi:hypothetical protein